MSQTREIELTCERMSYGPDAVARDDSGKTVFVEGAVAGDRVRAVVDREEDRYSRGRELQEPLYGREIAQRYTWLPGEFAQAVPRFLTELCFGDFATRTGLDGKTRELLLVTLLAALGGAEVQVKSHVAGALKAGSTREEIVCALVHASGYMGIPRLFNSLNACKELLASHTS